MSSPRVAHLVYDLIRGGTEGQCARIAIGLAKKGDSHRVAAFHRRGFFLNEVDVACGPVQEVAIRHFARPSTWIEIRRLATWLQTEQVELLHTWDADAAIFGQFAARLAGIPLVTSRRDLGQIYPAHKQMLLRRADRCAIRVVANAERVRSHFIAQGVPASHIEVLPNILDIAERDRLARVPFSGRENLIPGRRMVVVNRLDPEKNTGLLIQALPLVRKVIPDAVLLVVGDGPEMPLLRRQAAAAGVEAAVDFLGENMEVPAILRLCEGGALVPKSNEGLSNTILEYMAARLPVLATDCGGTRELVRDGSTGHLLSLTPSPLEVAEAWGSLLQQPDAAGGMGAQARAYVEQHHDMDVVLQAFRAFYARVIQG
jgi:L-malate glycosyltransferase